MTGRVKWLFTPSRRPPRKDALLFTPRNFFQIYRLLGLPVFGLNVASRSTSMLMTQQYLRRLSFCTVVIQVHVAYEVNANLGLNLVVTVVSQSDPIICIGVQHIWILEARPSF